ncbi:MAG TPA: hypothetical protein PK620_07365 [Denitromonas sp.]|uniref:hypothetical protein n=1 Tax=Denitromonas sp. TaxID=2734609 RepID=UPI001D8E03F1|nr:hypothetical protein [Rhodocyclaceae bacterium]MCP5223446.1 hypothetical protein [Zoogloeaceae bacterium]HPR08815.1 hypothetical protein [Denitromonas sp.]HQU88304.1 hypothetical protein [Denitromonas sp.]HQV14719.1 hypothetical protein [Denitromonas sp.]
MEHGLVGDAGFSWSKADKNRGLFSIVGHPLFVGQRLQQMAGRPARDAGVELADGWGEEAEERGELLVWGAGDHAGTISENTTAMIVRMAGRWTGCFGRRANVGFPDPDGMS